MNWELEVRRLQKAAVASRCSLPYDEGGIPFRLIAYRWDGRSDEVLSMNEGLDDRGRAALRMLAVAFRKLKPAAAVLQSDARMCDSLYFSAYFHISRRTSAPKPIRPSTPASSRAATTARWETCPANSGTTSSSPPSKAPGFCPSWSPPNIAALWMRTVSRSSRRPKPAAAIAARKSTSCPIGGRARARFSNEEEAKR